MELSTTIRIYPGKERAHWTQEAGTGATGYIREITSCRLPADPG